MEIREEYERTVIFLHGLDSSSQGTKARWFAEHYPGMLIPDFAGDLDRRLQKLQGICRGLDHLLLIGSSFGGLMAVCYAAAYPEKCDRLILLAPALNFQEFSVPAEKIPAPTTIIIGQDDTVTPPGEVLGLARQSCADLHVIECDDDHLLHKTFYCLDWPGLLNA